MKDKKDKKAIINPKIKNGKYFRYDFLAVLNYQEIPNHPERISNVKTFTG